VSRIPHGTGGIVSSLAIESVSSYTNDLVSVSCFNDNASGRSQNHLPLIIPVLEKADSPWNRMEHLQHYQRPPGWDELDGDQSSSPRMLSLIQRDYVTLYLILCLEPQGHAPLPHQVTGDTQSDSWDPQYPKIQGSANLISPSIQTNEQFTSPQNPQHGTQISGYGPVYPHSQPQDQHLSPLPPYGSNYNPGNYGIQGRGLPCRPPQHPNHQTGPQRTLSISTVPTNFTRHSYGSAGSGLNQCRSCHSSEMG
jgi:hypothetical protein